jgi:23S rRNA pseudouridine1911/1915/1917 synthase
MMPLPPILFEDETLVVFDKPSGLLVAPDRWDKTRAHLMGLVHAHPRYGRSVANVHRLDADTSGALLCAKDKTALDFLSGQFQSKTVEKRYHAVVVVLAAGHEMKVLAPVRDAAGVLPDTFTVEVALGEDERQPGRMRVFKGRGGKECVTEFRTLERFSAGRGGGGRGAGARTATGVAAGFAFVECRPLTGRTHQLRVHLAAAGAPILNDPFYGHPEIGLRLSDFKRGYKGREEEKPLLGRLALHASALTFRHPLTREPLTVRAPLPREFEVALKYLRKFAALPAGGPAAAVQQADGGSDLQEQLPPPHPVEEQPHHEQGGGAVEQRLAGLAEDQEESCTEVGDQIPGDKGVEKVRDEVGGD